MNLSKQTCPVLKRAYNFKDDKLPTEMKLLCANIEIIQTAIYTSISIISASVVLVAILVIRRKIWKIRYCLCVQLFKIRKRSRGVKFRPFLFDAFVSYTAEDRVWVHNVLMKQLEYVYGIRVAFTIGISKLLKIN